MRSRDLSSRAPGVHGLSLRLPLLDASCELRCGVDCRSSGLEPLPNLIVHTSLHSPDGHLDCVLDCARRRISVADDADAVAAEERRAAVITRIKTLERSAYIIGIDPGVLAQESQNHGSHGLVEFENDIPHETVTDYDIKRASIARAVWKIAPLEVAVEVEPCLLEECVRLFDHRVS